jgi:hypothetical protein
MFKVKNPYWYWLGLWKANLDLTVDLGERASRLNRMYLNLFLPAIHPSTAQQRSQTDRPAPSQQRIRQAFWQYLADAAPVTQASDIAINRVAAIDGYALLDWWTGEKGSGGIAVLHQSGQVWKVVLFQTGILFLEDLLDAEIPYDTAVDLIEQVFPYRPSRSHW